MRLLERYRRWLQGGGLLVGVDLVKSPGCCAAYNDAQGVTAAFSLNLLARANRELGADFDLAAWEHAAHYQPSLQRIEMHWSAAARSRCVWAASAFDFDEGEHPPRTPTKYSVAGFQALARRAGGRRRRCGSMARAAFSLHWLQPASTEP